MKVNRHEAAHQSSMAEINVIPLVDVMLVLLIIFMIAAPMMQQGVDVDLPEVNAGAVSASKEDLVLSIDGDGRIYIGDDKKTPYSLENVGDKLAAVFQNKEKKELYLHADKGVRYGYVVQVMAACQKAGVERMGMITLPEDTAK